MPRGLPRGYLLVISVRRGLRWHFMVFQVPCPETGEGPDEEEGSEQSP